MVSFKNFGRLGNFLYQAAAAYGYAKKHGHQFSVPYKTNNPTWNPLYLQHLVHLDYVQGGNDVVLLEVGHHYQEYSYSEEWADKQIILNGFNQSWKYFDFCREEMIKDFAFPYTKKDGWCSVHIRRGDYLRHPNKHPIVTEDYIEQAMKIIYERCGGNIKFKFFSDDIPSCKSIAAKMFLIFQLDIEFSEDNDPITDLCQMANCEHQVCSNSTMSVWAAELNQNPNKIVVMPSEKNWFGPGYKGLSVKDIYRPEWIKVYYN